MFELSKIGQEFVILYEDNNCQVLIKKDGYGYKFQDHYILELSPMFALDGSPNRLPDAVNEWLSNNHLEADDWQYWKSQYPAKNAVTIEVKNTSNYQQTDQYCQIVGNDTLFMRVDRYDGRFVLVSNSHEDEVALSPDGLIEALEKTIEWVKSAAKVNR